ncbi:DUF1134 domain-containing protein [Sphingomonas crusticola]|uniref:DUF1134 domain-containing protein n=1 Tax=Sphingomonas crusticola TaxID=1697973 RepID=UPI001F0729BE|nr:DUF1134 domain-containing protein [Sphingomonas crusticola]
MIGRTASMILAALLTASAAVAQVRTVDPNNAGAMAAPAPTAAPAEASPPPAEEEAPASAPPSTMAAPVEQPAGTQPPPPASQAEIAARDASAGGTFEEGDVVGAAEGVFGKGAAGLANLIEKIFKEQGRPNAYIAGNEAGGAVAIGVRYGSGTLFHKIEGQRPVFWTGPSIGFDLGANASKTFVLVYNLDDSQELYHRFPAAEGNVYAIGGFTASYLRRGHIVVIPIRLGVGLRLGANLGYMRFREKGSWLPF